MSVPSIIHASLRLRKLSGAVLLVVLLGFVTKCVPAKGPEPAARIPLDQLGFQPLSTQFLLAGSSMLTVDFVDDKHLLVTFGTKRLLPRLADCPPSDQDRVIEAVFVELPGGKLLARTSWRVHDHGQYLWNLGKGHFMLRNRDTLTTFAPMVNMSSGHAFRERPFITMDRRIGGVLLSPDADLMILETVDRVPEGAAPNGSPAQEGAFPEAPVQVNFFRLSPQAGEEVGIFSSGAFRARVPGRIPANSAGYVTMLDQGQRRWAFDFHTFGGKVKELSAFDSTCRPVPILVSRSEFIAFGCGLNHAPQVLGAFNMRGEEMWQQNLTESYVAPTFDYAPKGGRFAMSRVLTHSGVVQGGDLLLPELVAGQSIIVYQTDSGRQILHVDASPVARAGQNFALSPDGLTLAVVRGDAIEIHSLPPLTDKEREAVKQAEASAPRDDGAPVQLGEANSGGRTGIEGVNTAAPSEPSPAVKTEDPAVTAAPPVGTSSSNDAAPSKPTPEAPRSAVEKESASPVESPRKPPTLYNEPGERSKGSDGEEQKSVTPKQ
jgi:hypothetical protein